MFSINIITEILVQQKRRLSNRFSLFILILLGGCTGQYTHSVYLTSMSSLKLSDKHLVERKGEWVLPFDVRIALVRAESHSQFPRSRAALDKALRVQTPSEFPNTKYIREAFSLEDAIYQARAAGCDFVFYPRVLDLNNQRNQWSEILEGKEASAHTKIGVDTAEAELLIVDAISGRLLDRVKIHSRSSMFKHDNAQAMDLFDEAVSAALSGLQSGRDAS